MTANREDVHYTLPGRNTLKLFGHTDHFGECGAAVVETFDSTSKLVRPRFL